MNYNKISQHLTRSLSYSLTFQGFESEIVRKYDREVLDAFRKVFSAMPLAAVLDDECFVVHGGIGKLSRFHCTHSFTYSFTRLLTYSLR